MNAPAVAVRTHPVVEVFGPAIQGEGALAGIPTHFIRFGLCDYRCLWCDSMYAVDPEQVKEHAERLTDDQILDRLDALPGGPVWVTLSGGNPAMHNLGGLVEALMEQGAKVCVETQGSIWREWLAVVDCLTVSPKPPSSGMATPQKMEQTARFMRTATVARYLANTDGPVDALKIVVFDDADFEWAREQFRLWHQWPAYISCGTDPVAQWGADWTKTVSTRQVRDDVGDRYAWLCEKVAALPELAHVRVLPQLHVLAFGHARGV